VVEEGEKERTKKKQVREKHGKTLISDDVGEKT
jgi:hypothetical protein